MSPKFRLNRLHARLTLALVLGSATAIALPTDPTSPPESAAPTPKTASAPSPTPASETSDVSGLAAVYSDKLVGHRTASGKIYSRDKLTAAHKTLPFGTHVKVTNTKNGKTVVVIINDRGPKQAGRVLDLSPRAARALGIGAHAMSEVTLEVQK